MSISQQHKHDNMLTIEIKSVIQKKSSAKNFVTKNFVSKNVRRRKFSDKG